MFKVVMSARKKKKKKKKGKTVFSGHVDYSWDTFTFISPE